MRILAIIPAYNEEKNIMDVFNEIKEYNEKSILKIDYIIINDGSKDKTLDILRKNKLNYINLLNNLGIGGAVQTGYKYAYENLDKRSSNFQSTFMRRFGKNIISLIIRILCKRKITDPTSGFRAIDRNIIKIFADEYPTEYPEPESTVEVLSRGYEVIEVPVNMNERKSGKSFVNIWTSADYMIKVVLSIIIDSIQIKNKNKKGKR